MDTLHESRQRFKGKRVRVWYVMIKEDSWKAFIIDTKTKTRLAEGPVRSTPRVAVNALRSQIENSRKQKLTK